MQCALRYLEILDVTQKCDEQTDGQTDRRTNRTAKNSEMLLVTMARTMGQRGGWDQRLQLIADLYLSRKKTSSEQV